MLSSLFVGKPVSDSTYSRNQLTSWVYVRKGKLLHQWVRRLCVISGTRLLIYRGWFKSRPFATEQMETVTGQLVCKT